MQEGVVSCWNGSRLVVYAQEYALEEVCVYVEKSVAITFSCSEPEFELLECQRVDNVEKPFSFTLFHLG